MKLRIGLLAAAALSWGLAVPVAGAAEIKLEGIKPVAGTYGDNCLVARLSLKGDITLGDAERLTDVISRVDSYVIGKNSSCYLNDAAADRLIYIDLQSYGGVYAEGWKLAKLISDDKTLVSTYVSKDSYCYSACAVAFLGGSVPSAEGTVAMRRVIHPTAKLGFHAPFPVLQEGSYSAETVQGFFLAAFSVASSFMRDAQSLGITREVAQLLLQPTPDEFYEVNTSGRAMLTNVSVSSAPYDFSVVQSEGSGLTAITAQNLLNLCYNNQVLKSSGEAASIVDFVTRRQQNKVTPFTAVRTKARYFSPNDIPIDAVVVPVEELAEGEVLSCVSIVANIVSENTSEAGLKFACLAFDYGEKELADKIKKTGVNWLISGSGNRCANSSKLALLPWNTMLADIPEDFQED